MKGFLHPISLSNRWAVRLSFLILSVVCVSLGAHAQRWDNYPPANKYVRLTQTNLPIVFINVNTTMILREERITARMKIIDNGEGELNYADTVTHPGQRIDYDGYAAIKYRGNSSFDASDKKPYSIKLIDKPLEEGGEKLKAKLLGMGYATCSRSTWPAAISISFPMPVSANSSSMAHIMVSTSSVSGCGKASIGFR